MVDKITSKKILLSPEASKSFIRYCLKDYKNEYNKTDIKSVECIYYPDNPREYFSVSDLHSDNIIITEPVTIDHKIMIFKDKEIASLCKVIQFFITIKDRYTLKVIGTISIDECYTNTHTSDLFNKISNIALTDEYAFSGHKFNITGDDCISMKINYDSKYDLNKGCTKLIKLLEDALEIYYASLRKLAKGEN